MSHYDIIIVGGGMVGLAFAAKLKGSDLNIAVVDPKPVQIEFPEGNYDFRVSAITRASENVFREVNAWQFLEESHKLAYKKMFVWDGESTSGEIEFDAHSIGQENLGHIIENRALRKALFQSLNAKNNVKFIFEDPCLNVFYHDDSAELILHSGKKLSAKLLVASDGALSWLREKSKIQVEQNDYGHKAIVATIKTEKSHQATAYQRFDHKGPLAFLPLKNSNLCSIVWSQDSHFANKLCAMNERDFIEYLQQVFENKLGKLKIASKRISFPLIERTVETNINHRLALIGDAAHTIHPLAGQGVNLGLSDAKCLAETVLKMDSKNKDIGLKQNLRPYQRQRASDVLLMKQSMSGFKTVFGEKTPALQMVRATGMDLLNKQSLIKNVIIKKALGI